MMKKCFILSSLLLYASASMAEIPDGRYICSMDNLWIGDAGAIRGKDKYIRDLFSIDVDAASATIVAEKFLFPLENPLPARFIITRDAETWYEGISDEGAVLLFTGFSYAISNIYSKRTQDFDALGISSYLGQCNHINEDNEKIYKKNVPAKNAL